MNDNELVKALRDMATYDCGYEEQSDTANDAATRIERLARENAELKEAQRWVPVSERLPEDGVNVITVDKYGRVSKCNCLKSYVTKYGNYDNVTHWQPLPQPPKGE